MTKAWDMKKKMENLLVVMDNKNNVTIVVNFHGSTDHTETRKGMFSIQESTVSYYAHKTGI